MPATHPLEYTPYPTANPSGAPGGDFETIQARPEMFGALTGQATRGLGEGLERAADTGIDTAMRMQSFDDRIHGAELHSWFSDRATDLSEAFLEKKGRAAKAALPGYKQDLQNLFDSARAQAGNRDTEAILQTQTRTLMDRFYGIGSRHAATQQDDWAATTAKSGAASYGNNAVLFASQGDFPGADRALFASDQETRNHAETLGFEGPALDAQVARNRGGNVKNIVEQIANAEGPAGGYMAAAKWYQGQKDKIDAGSRVAIENYLKGGLAKVAGEKIGDEKMGRTSAPAAPMDIAARFVGAGERAQRALLSDFIGNIGGRTVDPATTSWCAAFVNAVLRDSGLQGSGSLMARSFLDVGQAVSGAPQRGDIVVFSRGDPNGPYGHVGFYAGPGDAPGTMKILGGNQGDKVSYADFPASQALGVRRVTAADIGQTPTIDRAAQRPTISKSDAMLAILNDPALQDRPNVQAAALARVNKMYEAFHLEQTQETAAFNVRLKDTTAEALGTGAVQHPLAAQEFVTALGPEKGAQEYEEYRKNLQLGADIASTASMSPEQIGELRARYVPPAGPGYAAQAKRAKALDDALDDNRDQIKKDPVGFLVARTDGGGAAWRSFQHLTADPHATPAMRAQYAAIYAEQMRALEAHAGVPPEAMEIVPKSFAAGLAARWRAPESIAAAPGQPGGAAGALAEINAQAALWGEEWPKVYGEIATKLDPALRVVASGVAPPAGIALLEAQHVKEGQIFGEQDDLTKQIFGKAVTDALKPFFQTLSGSAREQAGADYERAAKKLTAIYMVRSNGQMDAATAATQAVKDLLGFKYDFRGSIRVPKFDADGKPVTFTPDQIEAGAAAAKADLIRAPDSNLQDATKAMGLTKQEQFLYQRHLDNLEASHGGVANPTEGGKSTLYQMVAEHGGRFYNIPTVWDGKFLSRDEAVQRAASEGWEKWPSYASAVEADARYMKMHDYMGEDLARYNAAPPPDIAIVRPTGGVSADYARRETALALQRDGVWLTAKGDVGLKLEMPGRGAWPSASDPNRPFVLTWDELVRLGRDRRAWEQDLLGQGLAAGTGGGL
jgi:uncharacterized protein (TIGR02594 family)